MSWAAGPGVPLRLMLLPRAEPAQMEGGPRDADKGLRSGRGVQSPAGLRKAAGSTGQRSQQGRRVTAADTLEKVNRKQRRDGWKVDC